MEAPYPGRLGQVKWGRCGLTTCRDECHNRIDVGAAMPAEDASWKCLDHGAIEMLEDNLWRVAGEIPGMPLRRIMTVVRLSDGRLVIHSAVALHEEAMAQLEAWGTPSFLLVPCAWHRLDAGAFKARYPDMRVLCPSGARKKVEEVVSVDGSYDDFPSTDELSIRHLDGLENREGVLEVLSGARRTLIFNDIVMNNVRGKGLFWFVYAMIGSTGGPRVTRLSRFALVANRKALRADFERLADGWNLTRIIPGHGRPIVDQPADVLRKIAARL